MPEQSEHRQTNQAASSSATSEAYRHANMLMAFDFGTQKMGIAVGQARIESAQPLSLFPMKDGIPTWDALLKVVQEWQPELCLVGLPLNMDDSESELSVRARKFARRLRHQTNIATVMVDERLSTREARQTLQHYQQQGRGKKLNADSLAAALLLETWYREPNAITP